MGEFIVWSLFTERPHFAPWKVIWILESWKFFACKLWNPESWALDSSIQLKEFLLAIGIQNPRSIGKESRIQFLESKIHSMESTIQECLGLPYR